MPFRCLNRLKGLVRDHCKDNNSKSIRHRRPAVTPVPTEEDCTHIETHTEFMQRMLMLIGGIHDPNEDFRIIDTDTSNDGEHQENELTESSASQYHGQSALNPDFSEEDTLSDDRINRLVTAVEDGRGVCFASDENTGKYDAYVEDYSDCYEESNDDLEKLIAAAPNNFGRIIDGHNCFDRSQSPFSLAASDSEFGDQNLSASERSLGAEDEGKIGQSSQDSYHSTDSPSNFPRRCAENDRGRIIFIAGQSGIEQCGVSPVKLDYNKSPCCRTPSIHSRGTEQDCSSPLFIKSCKTMLEDAYHNYPDPENENFVVQESSSSSADISSQISDWLDNIIVPPPADSSLLFKERILDFEVWHDSSVYSSKSGSGRAISLAALKDITNLHRPGYLQHNSFAQAPEAFSKVPVYTKTSIKSTEESDNAEYRPVESPKQVASVFENFSTLYEVVKNKSGEEKEQCLENYFRGCWEPSMPIRGTEETGTIIVRDFASISQIETASSQLKVRERNVASLLQVSKCSVPNPAAGSLDKDPERDESIRFALARLEGRVSPPPPSPIVRYVDPSGVYNDAVTFEGHRIPLCHPTPLRSISPRELFARFEAAIEASAVNWGNKLEGCMKRPEHPSLCRTKHHHAMEGGNVQSLVQHFEQTLNLSGRKQLRGEK